ncbi:hypothetical protein lerEdw1_015094 [Lerista edwardsae]|nr:hypothetical protein lerEdw1_015096 [Lerista edwardsae]KAJ6616401.1 hypothetical protein lerEdw1_015094 [Lerista edwardsae]
MGGSEAPLTGKDPTQQREKPTAAGLSCCLVVFRGKVAETGGRPGQACLESPSRALPRLGEKPAAEEGPLPSVEKGRDRPIGARRRSPGERRRSGFFGLSGGIRSRFDLTSSPSSSRRSPPLVRRQVRAAADAREKMAHHDPSASGNSQEDELMKLNPECKYIFKHPLVRLIIAVFIILLIVVAALLGRSSQNLVHYGPACPEGWISYLGRCYYFSEVTEDWPSSEKFCSSYNGSLVIMENKDVKDFVIRYKCSGDYWVGLKKDGHFWKWLNGKPTK